MTRASWPAPLYPERTVMFLGDTHFGQAGYAYTERYGKIATDLAKPTVPNPAHIIQVGDLTHNGLATDSTTAMTFMDSLGEWHACVGNHDLWAERAGDLTRDGAFLAAEWGMPGLNYTVDLGFVVLVCVGPEHDADGTTVVLTADTVTWLDTTLATLAGRSVIVFGHAPLYNTVLGSGTTENRSDVGGFFLVSPVQASIGDGVRDTEIRAVLDAHACVRAYVSGHTHSSFAATPLAMELDIGVRTIGHVNCGSVFYVTKSFAAPRFDPIRSVFLTVNDDSLEVRWRDHGAGVWVGPDSQRVTTLTV